MPPITVEFNSPTPSGQAHLAELMQLYGFDEHDLTENRAGRVSPRQREALEAFRRSKAGVLLFAVLVLVGIGLAPRVVPDLPRECIVALFLAPFFGLWLLIELLRQAFPGRGRVEMVAGEFDVDSEPVVQTLSHTTAYLRHVQGRGVIRRYVRVGLLRRPRFVPSTLIRPDVTYRAYAYKSRTLDFVLSIEPLPAAGP